MKAVSRTVVGLSFAVAVTLSMEHGRRRKLPVDPQKSW